MPFVRRTRPARSNTEPGIRVDWEHPLAKNLLFYGPFFYGNAPVDLAANIPLVAETSSGVLVAGGFGRGLESTNANGNGVWRHRFRSPRLNQMSGAPAFSWAADAALDSKANTADAGIVMCVPWQASGAWGAPYLQGSFQTNKAAATTGAMLCQLTFVTGGTIDASTPSGATVFTLDGARRTYSATRDIVDVSLGGYAYVNGLLASNWDSGGSSSTGAQQNATGNNRMYLFGRGTGDGSSLGEGVDGRLYMSAMWARKLSAAEHAIWAKNPLCMAVVDEWIWTGATSGGVGATVNRAAETDTAQAIARSKSKAIGQAAESDFAQAVARYKARVAALAAETDTARTVGKSKARTAGQAAESDASRTITPSGAPVGGTVTQALETDAARTLSSSKAKAIGQAAELDLVQTILRVKARAVGQALEGDSARPISLPGSIGGTLSQAIESDLARSVGKAKAKAIAQALETDAGRAIAAMRAYAVGRASETDAAIAVAAIGKALALGVATEQDIARAFTVSGGAPVDFYYLREALEMAAASIIAALANTTVTVDVGGAGETSGVVAIQQERSFDPGLPGLRMASTSTEFLLEKKTAPASLKQGTLIRDETSSETYRVRRLNYNRGGIVTVEIERV